MRRYTEGYRALSEELDAARTAVAVAAAAAEREARRRAATADADRQRAEASLAASAGVARALGEDKGALTTRLEEAQREAGHFAAARDAHARYLAAATEQIGSLREVGSVPDMVDDPSCKRLFAF